MYLHGQFATKRGDLVTVHIVTGSDTTDEIEIGAAGSGLLFAESPVEVSSETNDTLDHLLTHSATVRLLTREYLPALHNVNCREAVVNIYRGETCIFAGYIEPQAYSQPYNEVLDELELNCVDCLSALQYSNYRNIGAQGVSYATVKGNAQQRTWLDMITEMLDGVTDGIDITGTTTPAYLFDGSKRLATAGAEQYGIFSEITLNELLFLGDDEDDAWTQSDTLAELLRYLDLHIVQDGFNFYIFSWATVKAGNVIAWQDITDDDNTATTPAHAITISNANAADCDTSITIDDVYNQIRLTCDVAKINELVKNPLDEGDLTSNFHNVQLYLKELSADGEGKHACDALKAMTHDEPTTFGEGRITEWYVQPMTHPEWTFPAGGVAGTDISNLNGSSAIQADLPNYLAAYRGAGIIKTGNIVIQTAKDDNSPVNKLDTDYSLVVSVNGDGDPDHLATNAPVAVYTGNVAGGAFSPVDSDTTNYIIITGNIALNPIIATSGNYGDMHNNDDWHWAGDIFPPYPTVPSRDNQDGRYYTRQYFTADTPTSKPYSRDDQFVGWYPYSDKGPQEYEYKYNEDGTAEDTVSKVPVLACMLIIGNKCLVERQGSTGQVNDYEWRTYKTPEQCSTTDEYYSQCFSIGFNPKIGDYIIGAQYEVQNNIDYTMGIDENGTAIPVHYADSISGAVTFKILGPYNIEWDNTIRKHSTWFRHASYSTNPVNILEHVSSIIISKLEIKVTSDSAKMSVTGDHDLVYLSDTREDFKNRKDITFKITSALTSQECIDLEVANSVNISTPVILDSGEALTVINDAARNIEAKPEKLYIDAYYNEYHQARIEMEQTIFDGADVDRWAHYTHPALNKTFFVEGITRDITDGTATLQLKEIEA